MIEVQLTGFSLEKLVHFSGANSSARWSLNVKLGHVSGADKSKAVKCYLVPTNLTDQLPNLLSRRVSRYINVSSSFPLKHSKIYFGWYSQYVVWLGCYDWPLLFLNWLRCLHFFVLVYRTKSRINCFICPLNSNHWSSNCMALSPLSK